MKILIILIILLSGCASIDVYPDRDKDCVEVKDFRGSKRVCSYKFP